MTYWVMVCQGLASGPEADVIRGSFLKSYDVEAYDGRGTAEWTGDVTQAMHFESLLGVLQCWRTVSRTRPRRADGEPNRPLTAFHVEPRRVVE